MNELSGPSLIEAAASAGDPGFGKSAEVGESGPAGVTGQLHGTGDSLLHEAGGAGRMLSDDAWNPGAPPEIGDAGPASPGEHPGDHADAIALPAIGIAGGRPAEPGELGPAVNQYAGDMERAMTKNLPAAGQPSGKGQAL